MTNTQYEVSGSLRKIVRSDSPLEAIAAFSRATRIGNYIWVAGVTATATDGSVVGGLDATAQAREVFRRIEDVLASAGAALTDVVRTRAFARDLESLLAFGQEHARVFSDVFPASTAVLVSGLVHPDAKLEVEIDAYVAASD